MSRFAGNLFKNLSTRFVLALLAATTILAGWSGGQTDDRPPQCGEGSLLYRSPISGRYEAVALVHTDAAVDVRGLSSRGHGDPAIRQLQYHADRSRLHLPAAA